MKLKKAYRWVVSLLLAVTMMAMPVGAAIFNVGNSVIVKASDGAKETESVSDNGASEPKCICVEKCSTYDKNENCPICKEDSTKCAYIEPNVKISISTPNGWYKDGASVAVKVEDTKETGNFKIKTVEARISQNGSWVDITDEMIVEVSENCSVYVQVTDQNGKTYNKNKYIDCFDTVKPTLNAAVNDGLLSIQGIDNDSGIKAIYINGYEFKELTNGVLNIRLQQFDAGYQYFTLQAVDNAGNMSEVYKTSNPYYEDPTVEKDSSDTSQSTVSQLPVSATATEPTNAKATVTEHTKDTGSASGSTSNAGSTTGTDNATTEDSEGGKEFYTITTKSDKVFYLIIDKDQTENNVYLLTEAGENDLLNFTESDTDTLPQNSAVVESALPSDSSTINTDKTTTKADSESESSTEIEEGTDVAEEVPEPEESSNAGTYMIMAIALFGVGGAYYYLKFIKGKRETFEDEEDFDEDEEVSKPEYETEEDDAKEETEEQFDDESESSDVKAEKFEDGEDDYM